MCPPATPEVEHSAEDNISPWNKAVSCMQQNWKLGYLTVMVALRFIFFLVSCCMWCIFWRLVLCLKANFSTAALQKHLGHVSGLWLYSALSFSVGRTRYTSGTTLCYDSDCWTCRRQYSLRTTFYYIVSGLKGKNSSNKAWFSLSSFRNEMW